MNMFKIISVIALTFVFATSVAAQEKQPQPAQAPAKEVAKQDSSVAKDKMMPPKMGMGMHCMAGRQMLLAPDGSVIVMSGNRLLKYDANLVLQKEATLPQADDMICKHPMEMDKTKQASEKPVQPAVQDKSKAQDAKPAQPKKP